MNTSTLVKRHVNAGDYKNEPSTLYEYRDVLAVAEVIYGMMRVQNVGEKIKLISIFEVNEAVEHVLSTLEAQTDAFKFGFVEGSNIPSERFECVAYCCQDLVQKNWLDREEEGVIFPNTFWKNPDVDQHEQVKPTHDFMLLMRRHFQDDARS